jgi:hypothetical protein
MGSLYFTLSSTERPNSSNLIAERLDLESGKGARRKTIINRPLYYMTKVFRQYDIFQTLADNTAYAKVAAHLIYCRYYYHFE